MTEEMPCYYGLSFSKYYNPQLALACEKIGPDAEYSRVRSDFPEIHRELDPFNFDYDLATEAASLRNKAWKWSHPKAEETHVEALSVSVPDRIFTRLHAPLSTLSTRTRQLTGLPNAIHVPQAYGYEKAKAKAKAESALAKCPTCPEAFNCLALKCAETKEEALELFLKAEAFGKKVSVSSTPWVLSGRDRLHVSKCFVPRTI
jgi:hypothetical protein